MPSFAPIPTPRPTTSTPLSCSQCPSGHYSHNLTRGRFACDNVKCDHIVSTDDIVPHLDDDEALIVDTHGRLALIGA